MCVSYCVIFLCSSKLQFKCWEHQVRPWPPQGWC